MAVIVVVGAVVLGCQVLGVQESGADVTNVVVALDLVVLTGSVVRVPVVSIAVVTVLSQSFQLEVARWSSCPAFAWQSKRSRENLNSQYMTLADVSTRGKTGPSEIVRIERQQ